ncbi:hypothetical protein ABVT39_005680 [Epinephelus coioides]
MAEKARNYTVGIPAACSSSSRRTREAEEHLPRPSTSEQRELQPSSEESELPAPPPIASEPGSPGAESPSSHSQQQCGLPEDLGVDKPVQVRLKQFPKKQQHNNDCKRSFSANWYNERDWLEYSQKQMPPFVFPTGNLEGVTPFSQELDILIGNIIEFLVSNKLPLRGDVDSVNSGDEAGSGLFLSLFDYMLRQNQELAKAFSTIPKNATYTSHDIQNHIIELMSMIVTEQIVKDVGESWFTLKVDGTKDPTGSENVSIVVREVDKDYKVQERLLSMQTTDKCDAQSLTNVVLNELSNAGLDTNKILSQCYDGASVMSGREEGMQKLIQNNTQYKGGKLKRLLEQRWTGHFDTVSVVLKSHTALVDFLKEIGTTGASADVKIEAVGLHKAIIEWSFKFLACVMHKVLGLMDPANRMLQAEETDLITAVWFKVPPLA